MNYAGIGVKVKQQPTLHDVPNCCWHIDIGGEKAFYATDMSTLEGIEAKDYDLYMIESNRSEEDIDEAIEKKVRNGQFSYEIRAKSTHFLEGQAKKFLSSNMGFKSKYLFLHQHIDTEHQTTEQ